MAAFIQVLLQETEARDRMFAYVQSLKISLGEGNNEHFPREWIGWMTAQQTTNYPAVIIQEMVWETSAEGCSVSLEMEIYWFQHWPI